MLKVSITIISLDLDIYSKGISNTFKGINKIRFSPRYKKTLLQNIRL